MKYFFDKKKLFRKRNIYILIIAVLLALALFKSDFARSQGGEGEMISDHYKIWPSSINVGGAENQVSTPGGYKLAETIGEIATGPSTSSGYKLKAGYRQVDEVAVYISLTVPTEWLTMDQPSNMSITVNTVTNNSSRAAWGVATNAPAGYTLSFSTNQTNCLRIDESNFFSDYSESSPGTPDETWSIEDETYQFGFSAFGNDVNTGTWGSGTACYDVGTTIPSNKKYMGFKNTENILAASSDEPTSGTDTMLCLAAEQKAVFAPPGQYNAQITATAVTQ